MSRTSLGILGAIAVSLSLGAAQFASGHDLGGTLPVPAGTSDAGINRAAKADRAPVAAAQAAPTRTISLQLESLADTSVLIRLPVVQTTRKEIKDTPEETRTDARTPAAPALTKPGNRRLTEACEPVVSVLTDVVKQLQPGRCVT